MRSSFLQSPFSRADLKPILTGAGACAAFGLLLGAAMQPNLRGPTDVEGPQMLAGVSGARQPQLQDVGASFAAYETGVPDYVVGTDWLEPPEQFDEEVPIPVEDETVAFAEDDAYEPVAIVRWEEPPREPARYPSLDGGVAYGVAYAGDLPAPPPPPEDSELAEMAAATPG